jgi:hypothetical protein
MKNFVKFVGIVALAAVIGFSMTACASTGGGAGGNGLTITGLGAYNGYYVSATALTNNDETVYAAADVVGCMMRGQVRTGGVIRNGSVTLPVWTGGGAGDNEVFNKRRYNGNDELRFELMIWQGANPFDWDSSTSSEEQMAVNAKFQNGVARGAAFQTFER